MTQAVPTMRHGSLRTSRWAWTPDAADLSRSRLLDFAATVGATDRPGLETLARHSPEKFWSAVWSWLGLEWQRPPTSILAPLSSPEQQEWFPGGAFNIADACIDRWVRLGRGDDLALVAETETGPAGRLTFAELAAEVDRVARGLAALALTVGDRVAIQMPSGIEAAVAHLACARLGLITVPVFSGFGVSAIAERARIAGVSAYIVVDAVHRRGRAIGLRDLCATVQDEVPSITTFIVVASADPAGAGTRLRNEISWDQLGAGSPAPVPAATLPADHPLAIAFTSGTTGAPKGTVLSQAGFALKAASDVAWCFDTGPEDTIAWITDPGWVMSPITLFGGLLVGATVAFYDGAPNHPGPARVWEFARSAELTVLGVSPTLVRSLMMAGTAAVPPSTAPLRLLASSGEPWTPEAFSWLSDTVCGGRVPVINYSGGTEVSGAILSNFTCEPISACGFAGPVPGMGAAVADESGADVRRGQGELVLRTASPGMTLDFWSQPDGRHETYWSTWPGVWRHGDTAEINDDGVWFIRGRSDDTLKVAGKRIGPAEFEAIVNSHPAVHESIAVGIPDPVKGEAVAIFVQLRTAQQRTAEQGNDVVEREIRDLLLDRLGRPLLPRTLCFVQDLPRTRSGKLMRKLARSVFLGDDAAPVASVENPAALEEIRRVR